MRIIALALALPFVLVAAAAGNPGAAADDGYLIPPSGASEEPIVVGHPATEPTPRLVVRDTVVERPLAYQDVEFGALPEAVTAHLARFKLKQADGGNHRVAYAGSAEFLGTPTALAALFTPASHKLFSLAFTTALKPGESWSANLERYEVRRNLLTQKYGLPARELEARTAGEAVWKFADGEIQCTVDSGAVKVVYVHEPGLRLMREEAEALRQERESKLQEEL